MTVNIATFRARYPEFDDPIIVDATLQILLDDAVSDFSRSKLSSSEEGQRIYDRIVFSLAAHNAQLGLNRAAGNTAGGAAINNKSVGKVSVGYSRATSTGSDEDFYLQTIYGQTFLQLLNKYCPAAITIC